MSNRQSRVPGYLEHMLSAITRINRYTAQVDRAAFLEDELVQDAVIRNIEVLGEAANNILQRHPEFAAKHDDVPWADIYAMRNRVAHGYFSVDMAVLWETVQRDIPKLEQDILQLRKELG